MMKIFSRDKGEKGSTSAVTMPRRLDYSRTPILLGVDTGNKLMKTPHSSFHSGLQAMVSEPGFLSKDPTDLIKYNNMSYQVNEIKRVSYQEDKSKENEYLILTLIGIAKKKT